MATSGQSSCKSVCSVLIPRLFLGLLFIYFYCEYFIYYVTQIQCGFPELKRTIKGEQSLRVMLLADTHFLGSRHGHWLDKWRREWQMERAFQTAITLHQPEAVFVLGDLFDEGKWCTEREFNDYVKRFTNAFRVPDNIQFHVVVGNHDIGFHHSATPYLLKRFETKMKSPIVSLVSIRSNHFVLVNSVALEGDGCNFCARAVKEIEKIADTFKCTAGSSLCKGRKKLIKYTRPIILQHYPLYRPSDEECSGPDLMPYPARSLVLKPRYDCLSKESTDYLVQKLSPRAAFGGHTHHSCFIKHRFLSTNKDNIEFPEYSLSSFSWRNRVDPKYYLVTISNDEVAVAKCDMVTEDMLLTTAVIMLMILLVYLVFSTRRVLSTSYRFLPNKDV